ncbi:MAG: hypothetical protein JSS07_04520 [Proteobacteria bacterium]|nr:hypothetical protein [Pseudomonadota bacterium]
MKHTGPSNNFNEEANLQWIAIRCYQQQVTVENIKLDEDTEAKLYAINGPANNQNIFEERELFLDQLSGSFIKAKINKQSHSLNTHTPVTRFPTWLYGGNGEVVAEETERRSTAALDQIPDTIYRLPALQNLWNSVLNTPMLTHPNNGGGEGVAEEIKRGKNAEVKKTNSPRT